MRTSPTITKLAEALAKAQGEMKGAKKDSENPHFKSKYADLESTWEACREPLTKHGLSVVQLPYSTADGIGVNTMLLHESGEFIEGEIAVKTSNPSNPQIAGSIITYLRRYSLQGVGGIAPEDDDGNAASPQRTAAPLPEVPPKAAGPGGGVTPPASPPPDGKKSLEELRRELDELAEITVDSGHFGNTGEAIQWATSTEKFQSKCRQAGGLTKDWQVERAIKKLLDKMNAPPPPDEGGDDQDIKF